MELGEEGKVEKAGGASGKWGRNWKRTPGSKAAPSNPKPVKWRLSDIGRIPAEEVVKLKAGYVEAMRRTGKAHLSAEEVGVTTFVVGAWLEGDSVFREDVEHARRCRIDELEADLEGSQNRSGGDVTARIFRLKGELPDKYMERIAQQTYQVQVYEPEFRIEGLRGEEKKQAAH